MTTFMLEFLIRHLMSQLVAVGAASKRKAVFPAEVLTFFMPAADNGWEMVPEMDRRDHFFSFFGSDELFETNFAAYIANFDLHYVLCMLVHASDLLVTLKLSKGASIQGTLFYVALAQGVTTDNDQPYYELKCLAAVKSMLISMLKYFYFIEIDASLLNDMVVVVLPVPKQPSGTVSCGQRLYLHLQHALQISQTSESGKVQRDISSRRPDEMIQHFQSLSFTEDEVQHFSLFLYWLALQYALAHMVYQKISNLSLPPQDIVNNILAHKDKAEFEFFSALNGQKIRQNRQIILPIFLHTHGYSAGAINGKFLLLHKSLVAKQPDAESRFHHNDKVYDVVPYIFDENNRKIFGAARLDALVIGDRHYIVGSTLVGVKNNKETNFVLVMLNIQLCGKKWFYVQCKDSRKTVNLSENEVRTLQSDATAVLEMTSMKEHTNDLNRCSFITY